MLSAVRHRCRGNFRNYSNVISIGRLYNRKIVKASGNARFLNVFMDYSWAIEPLKARGVELKVAPRTEEDEKDEAVLDNPPDKINDLADQVLALNYAEMHQFQRRFWV